MLFLFLPVMGKGAVMEQDVYAVVDIGSNSLRFMRGKRDRDGQWHFSKKELATTRLGKDVSRTGHLSREGIEASLEAMQQWNDAYPDLCVCAVATSAVREASDGQAFLAEVRARFGWHCRILSGLEEASFSYRGAAGAALPGMIVAVLDIGGGSSEMALGKEGRSLWSHSYPMGAVRFCHDVTTAAACDALERRCLNQWLSIPAVPDRLLGVGGTLTSLAAMELGLDLYDPDRVEGTVISRACLSDWIDRLEQMTPEERRHIKGLQPRRSDIILPGLLIARSCLSHYGIPEIQISEKDLLEGIFYSQAFQDAAWRNR